MSRSVLNGWKLSGSEQQGRKKVLKRSVFTHVQQLPVNTSDEGNIHCEPVLNDYSEITTWTSASESDAEEFYDFDNNNADLQTAVEGCSSESSAALETDVNTPVESFSDMTPSMENLTVVESKNDGDKKAEISDNIPPRLPQCSQSFFCTKTDIGIDALKYWPPPSRTEAFHLSEAIIKFTRDVEAAKHNF